MKLKEKHKLIERIPIIKAGYVMEALNKMKAQGMPDDAFIVLKTGWTCKVVAYWTKYEND